MFLQNAVGEFPKTVCVQEKVFWDVTQTGPVKNNKSLDSGCPES